MHKAGLVLIAAVCSLQSLLFADDGKESGLQRASFYYWTHFVSGPLITENGSTRFPLLYKLEETKIAIFANNTDARTMEIATAVDSVMKKYSQLRYSFMVVGKESDAESMTDDQFEDQLEHLRSLAKQHNIQKLSLGCVPYRTGQGSRGRFSLELLQGADVVLAVVEPGILEPRQKEIGRRLPMRTVRPFYRHLVRFRQADPDPAPAEEVIENALRSLLN